MPFSRYQIRNEFSLADPELYKAADKDDPEALLEGVAMAGLVGVLRQLGDLAEFAAEIFHGLHEEVMVTATRGHGLLVRVQQLESDFPPIERAFLSQTGHSAFFSSSGIGWHPNLQTDQNLITKGDLPRFVMDSYEECRGPPRLFLLDKFDVAGAGACLKRYTDPSFYRVEASSFEMRNTETHRDKNVRKTKKKGSRWKNGETPDVFQPSHVKLHQLLLEERMQNGASEPSRHVKLKKREIKFPFDTETGKGYMESLLSSPPEDKLVHEVPIRPGLENHEGSIVNSPSQNGSPFESPSIDKSMNNMPGLMIPDLPENDSGVSSGIEEEEVEEKHMSDDRNHKADNVIADGYESDDVVSEGENYVDALATMESEIETETEVRGNSDPSVEQIQSHFSDYQSDNETESGSIKKKIENFSYSDSSTTSTDNTPRSATFASTEIPFRPRILTSQVSDEGVVLEESESGSKEQDLSEMSMSSSNRVEENEIVPEAITASKVDDLSSCNRQSEDGSSNFTLENMEEQSLGPSLEEVDICDTQPSENQISDDVVESNSEGVANETELKEDSNKDNNLSVIEDEKESVNSVTNPDDIVDESKEGLSTCEDTELDGRKVESEIEVADENDDAASTTEEPDESGVVQDSDESVGPESEAIPSSEKELSESGEKKESDISTEIDSVPSVANDHSNIQLIDTDENGVVDDPSANLDQNPPVLEETVENGDIQSNPQFLDDSGAHETTLHHDIVTQVSDEDVKSELVNNESYSVEQGQELQDPIQSTASIDATNVPTLHCEEQEPSIPDVPQPVNLFDEINYPLVLPQLPPIDMEEMPPLPPLPPMQWIMGKPNTPNDTQNNISHFPPSFPQIVSLSFPPIISHPSLEQNEIAENHKSQHDNYQHTEISSQALPIESTSHTEEHGNTLQLAAQPPVHEDQSQIVSTSWQSNISLIPEADEERPNGIRPMKIQRPRTPLIDAVASHDKSKLRKVPERTKPQIPEEEEKDTLSQLRKVSERSRPQIPIEGEKDTLLEQIRAKSFNLKPAVQTRPSIQGPSTNLRVAAILEKANAIRHAFAGSDEDEDDDDSWSDS
ncbi:hypothetical protein LXL04_036003 [Taraxacum kok-saghyz]